MTNAEKERILSMRKANITYAAIAEELGIPVGTIKTFCRRATKEEATTEEKGRCKNCGMLLPKSLSPRERVFCSDKCKQAWWNKHRNARKSEKIIKTQCLICGKTFTDYGTNHRKYCSPECYRKRGAANG